MEIKALLMQSEISFNDFLALAELQKKISQNVKIRIGFCFKQKLNSLTM
jgi:hypothetical protein